MSDVDTSAEAVECMARYYDDEGRHMEVANNVGDAMTAEYAKNCRDTAATLRALLARAEAAPDRLATALTDMHDACDAIARQRDAALKNGCLAGHKAACAERDAARAEAARLREALAGVHQLSLVLSSAVRRADPAFLDATCAAIRSVRRALGRTPDALAEGGRHE